MQEKQSTTSIHGPLHPNKNILEKSVSTSKLSVILFQLGGAQWFNLKVGMLGVAYFLQEVTKEMYWENIRRARNEG